MKNSIKKILIAHSSNDLYGSSKILITTIEILIKNGFDIHLFLPCDGPLNKMAIINKRYKTLLFILVSFILSTLSLLYFGSEEIRYLIIDTLKFENTSSLGHLVEWIEGVLSIFENPLGIGLAMSGNASGVDQAIKVGGENQFLIFGVQMGVVSIIVYVLILFNIIKRSSKVYLNTSILDKHISFIVACTKFGLLLPLLTANAELYLFVSLTTWFFAGYVESRYTQIEFEKNKSLY